ncbi:carbohydrate sulfotransferase 15-like [Patella vulgata]|uniref:carbohydrate sulfotransferase 15-like n=1 Tax=Patella vulgata TaxID=6465 RepID=UPI0024A9E423|nr:carbohydrate sulfotransferase 15-like [Patella vulgata]
MPQNKDKTADNALLTPDALHHLLPKSYFLLIFRNPTERILVGMYVVYLKEWFKVFEKDRFLIIKTEEYPQDIKTHVQRIFQFLGLNTLSDGEMEKIVKQSRKNVKKQAIGPMWQETRQILDDLYRSYNEELAELLADNKYLWKDDPK